MNGRRNKQKKDKRSKPRSKTKLWMVGLGYKDENYTGGLCIIVQPAPPDYKGMTIRSISGHAAGRKYQREILPFNRAAREGEWFSWGGGCKPNNEKEYRKAIQAAKKKVTKFKIVVMKG